MTGILIATISVAWFGAIIYFAIRAMEKESWKTGLIAAIILIIGLGILFEMMIREEQSGPCVQSEIQMHWNPATKTMMPAKVCTLRGEWVE